MQIGSSLPLSHRINRASPQLEHQPERQTDAANHAAASDKAPKASQALSVDYVKIAEKVSESRESTGFYSMDRTFSHKAQEALSFYMSNESFVNQAAAEQWVGVDLYV